MSIGIFELTAHASAPAVDDVFAIVDVHDTTQAPQGSTKKITTAFLFTNPTITTAATITGGTVTVSTPVVNATQTWNAGGVTFTGMKVNVTDTASAAGSLLADLQVATVSKFSVTKAGVVTAGSNIVIGAGAAAAGSLWTAATSGVILQAKTGSANDFQLLNPAGNANIFVVPTGTTNTAFTGAMSVAVASTTAFTVGQNGATNPAFSVDSSPATQASGLNVGGSTAAGTVGVVVLSSGADTSLSVNAKGAGTIAIGTVSTGAITLGRATTISAGGLVVTAIADYIFNNSGARVATNATSGFLFLPICNGTPSSAPTNIGTGRAAVIIDDSAGRIWVYQGAAWKSVLLT